MAEQERWDLYYSPNCAERHGCEVYTIRRLGDTDADVISYTERVLSGAAPISQWTDLELVRRNVENIPQRPNTGPLINDPFSLVRQTLDIVF